MRPTARRLAIIAVATAALAMTTSCGSDKPAPIPSTSATSTPTPSVSPPPGDATQLPSEEQAGYDAAVQKFAEYNDFIDRIAHDPMVTQEIALEAGTLATDPAVGDLSDSIDELVRNDAHVEGSRDVAWSSPVSVTKDKVVFLQCQTPGSWVLVGSGHRAPDKSNTVRRVTVVKFKGKWVVKNNERTGEC